MTVKTKLIYLIKTHRCISNASKGIINVEYIVQLNISSQQLFTEIKNYISYTSIKSVLLEIQVFLSYDPLALAEYSVIFCNTNCSLLNVKNIL